MRIFLKFISLYLSVSEETTIDWRQKLIVQNVLNKLLSEVSSPEELVQTGSGTNEEPNRALLEWQLIKQPNGNEAKRIYSSRFRREQKQFQFNIKHNFGAFSDLFSVEHNIDQMFNKFNAKQMEKCWENDLISLSICHEELEKELGNIFIPPFRKKDFDASWITILQCYLRGCEEQCLIYVQWFDEIGGEYYRGNQRKWWS